jgi:hypothetical protein
MSLPFLPGRAATAVVVSALVFVAACGSRGPLDVEIVEEGPGDGATVDAVTVEAAVDSAADADGGAVDAPEDRGRPGFDGGPIVNCGACVAQSCGQQFLTCLSSAPCRTALQCVVTTCLSGGTPDPACVGTCTQGDQTVLGQLIGAFTCIITNCGSQCTGVLGGLGGGGGGGGGGGSGGGGGAGG